MRRWYIKFLSHSSRDHEIVLDLAKMLAKLGTDVYVAEWNLSPGSHLDEKILREIDNCDAFLVILTRNGARSNWVQQEIGYALKAGKVVVPLVDKGVEQRELGALLGREYIEYDPDDPQQSLTKASVFMNSLKSEKESGEWGLFVVGGIILLFLMLSGKGGN